VYYCRPLSYGRPVKWSFFFKLLVAEEMHHITARQTRMRKGLSVVTIRQYRRCDQVGSPHQSVRGFSKPEVDFFDSPLYTVHCVHPNLSTRSRIRYPFFVYHARLLKARLHIRAVTASGSGKRLCRSVFCIYTGAVNHSEYLCKWHSPNTLEQLTFP
jgi:hypothetical protein